MGRGPSVTIVGPGRLGQALGRLLAQGGVTIDLVAARQFARARKAVQFIGAGTPAGLDDARLKRANVVLLTTADAAIEPVARALAAGGADWQGKVVLHTCGSLPSSVLRPLARRAAAIGSIHPFQTVPNPATGVRNLPGCYWAIEGDTRARAVGARIVRRLDGKPFLICPARKVLYHASAFLVCPTVLALLDQSERLLRLAGVPSRVTRSMLAGFVSETVGNFARLGARRALTGPAVRGDWPTMEKHLRELRRYAPEALPVYRELLRAIVRLAGRRLPRHWERLM
jgi:predicted short-subunit dehydrogenase-like oxidoreductase (DUF2520 family)